MSRKPNKTKIKYLTENTFEKHMRSLAKSMEAQGDVLESHSKTLEAHSKILESHSKTLVAHGKVLEQILEEMKTLHEDNKKIRDTLSNFVADVLMHDRKISNLTVRVEKLEAK